MRKILFVLALLASMPAIGEPLVRQHTSFYYIDGTSATVLAAQLDQIGPVEADAKHYAGKTRWDVQWRLKREQKGTTCSIKEVAIAVDVMQAMPRWRGEDKGAAGLKALWSKFIAALQAHEDGHKAYALKAGKEIETALTAIKPASNCEDLELAANTAAQGILTKYQELNEAYDRKTDHGRNEGATLL